jgi:protoporphyrinogen oxidase
MKIAIIGSGVSGLSIARILEEQHQVVVFEKDRLPGGLIKCERVEDNLFHKVGGHVFNTRNKRVHDWFWSYFSQETEFVKAKRNAKIFFNNQIIGYPIENYLYLFEKEAIRNIIDELLALQKLPKISPFEYENFEEFLKGNFGKTLYETYFKPYNEKIWKTDLSTVAMEWLEGKLPMPNLNEIIENNIIKREEENMVHATFFYPVENGSQFIVDRLKRDLEIRTGEAITKIEREDSQLKIKDEFFDKIVYCGDIRQLPDFAKQVLSNAGVDLKYIENLRSNGTSNLFCETDDTDISWLYIPEDFTMAHRIIYTGNFSNTNNRGSNRKTCVVEFSGKVELEVMKEEIKKLPGNLSPLSYNYEPNSYVVQDHRTRAEINKAKKALEVQGIFLLGRFAEWEYYNMDKAIEAAFNLSEQISFLTANDIVMQR